MGFGYAGVFIAPRHILHPSHAEHGPVFRQD
jgi:hypothetical protein